MTESLTIFSTKSEEDASGEVEAYVFDERFVKKASTENS